MAQEKRVDLLDADDVLAGQRFCCLSFVSPENILKNKELFLFKKFLKNYELTKVSKEYQDFMGFIAYKYNMKAESLQKDFQEFLKNEKDKLSELSTVDSDFATFLEVHEDALSQEFDQQNNFRTSVRGLKVRGSFNSREEAERHCKMLREKDPNHNIYVCDVGVWVPWDPNPLKTGSVEYAEKELNELFHEKSKNEAEAKQYFEQRVTEAKKKAIEENMEKAEKSGNVLTQTIDKDGNLTNLTKDSNSANLMDELFNQDNVENVKVEVSNDDDDNDQ